MAADRWRKTSEELYNNKFQGDITKNETFEKWYSLIKKHDQVLFFSAST